jgi:3-oxoacyl-[acyl-carrier protein] reductase
MINGNNHIKKEGIGMDLGLKDKVVIVVASSSGLGLSTAVGFAREGAKVVISGRDAKRLKKASEKIFSDSGVEVETVQMDVRNADDIDRLVATVIEKFGTIHVLVNNAGGPPPGVFWETDDEAWNSAYELTLLSSVRLTRAALPYMRKQKWGRIINITSMTVKQPIDQLLLSNSLRLGVVGWAKTLSNQVAKEGILINNVCPGWTMTERVAQITEARADANQSTAKEEEKIIASTIPMGRLGEPEEFANLVVFLGSERASYITGTSIQVDGGATAGFY